MVGRADYLADAGVASAVVDSWRVGRADDCVEDLEGAMERERAEANWIWDPRRGYLRPKEWPKNRRIRPTDRNIMAQQIARCGTLIHTTAKTTCPRKACKIDERTDASGTVTQLAVATFIDNVNCLWCRKDYFSHRYGTRK